MSKLILITNPGSASRKYALYNGEELMAQFHFEYEGKKVDLSPKKASQNEIIQFFTKALPTYDTDRVHVSDMRKVLAWYNILIENDITEFEEKEEAAEAETPAEEKAEAKA